MDYKDTLLMPKTEFQMRGNLGVREPEFQKRWEDLDLYNKVLKKNKDQKPFILHDGPPYANGDIHIGHALNKILKDFVLRYQTMKGHYVPYIPGWDTHGLPIETALTKKGINRKEISLVEYRKLCKKYAEEQVERQKGQFQRLGILGEWDNPYITYTSDFEAEQINVFAKMVERGLIYKGLKPVYWSPSSESALAEAEIEYQDKQSTSVYVAFPSIEKDGLLKDANFLIWTTTPWTLPANLAISVHPRFNYVVVLADTKKYVVAETLLTSLKFILKWTDVKVLGMVKGQELEFKQYKHPLYERVSPIIVGEHVTDTDGTGLVHTAPGHGEDDYRIGRTYNLDILCPVDDKGYMMEEAGQFSGLYYEVANEEIVKALAEANVLLKSEKFTHSYPHDWRTKKPVIFRATPQWFASIEQLKNELLDEVKKVDWIPVWGEVRISNMISGREDWCISRQRAWGVPIPVFYAENGDAILDQDVLSHVSNLFRTHGSDIWYEKDAKDLLPVGYKHPGSPHGQFRKETDIMDVWFDSGTSHSVLQSHGLPYPADLYLEGSDQYRGWFNSSLITGVAAFKQSPYKKVVSHGFVLDGQGRKMSKSLGNTVDPLAVMKQQGADILRLWVATVDYQSDVRISNDMMTQIAEGYRKIRNTLRFMLGNLDGFDPKQHYVEFDSRGKIDQVMTIKYDGLVNEVLDAYENYAFDRVYRSVVPFMTNELSAFYLDYTKDIMYIEKENSLQRRAVQSTIYDLTLGLLKLLTPIIPHTTSEAYQLLPFSHEEDVYLENMPERKQRFDQKLMSSFDTFMEVREVVLKKLEEAREQKVIGKSLAAEIDLVLTEKHVKAIESLEMKLHQVLIVSKVKVSLGSEVSLVVAPAEGTTCDRCWNVVDHVHENGLCDRCNHVLGGNK
ncbi:MAG: isoleucine--tRNA ligase [Tenericutes bacterium GWC2_34_14]|nr:MAG: isoleucine--tRNA ligase [Tenericutes bacterium GWC2_34_14]OHE34198.1 MAG: isoleucine--tRNA ligase [Tenericutes bacterium GWE2_34_108]OHE35529.1 MAG: isoleucine--tRNA ligase [Tenericutes bacterium GWF1_35_14]OHE38552.1 MAG: isoleucine--tRNA ligase [Tenericutes bacterium GWF2_35_184]OHE41610.1 MAG: isoleucine--tRNA ligase [Tenericutes bacterium RIFOXYA12_FULL_35_10]OHE43730.1 MAG: isoleucine--tRNA ligase [Tenericutes bacterium RIFOXYA2_FULL_36_32]OHE45749.1 MAG: isoleucine--tRNA ligase 